MRPFTPLTPLAAVLTCAALLAGCASTRVESTGLALKAPLCRPGGERIAVVAFWQTQWRADQKEPALREAAAQRGLEDFFASTACVGRWSLRRLSPADAPAPPSDDELLRLASAAAPGADRVLRITVRELGPTLRIGLPVLVEGGTEVVLEIRALDPRSAQPLADLKTHWQNGGRFVVKGVKTLPADMASALQAALLAGPRGE